MERGGLTVRKEDCSPGALRFLSSLKDNIPEAIPQPAENNQQACMQTRHIRGSSQGIAHDDWQEDKPSDIRFIDDTNYFLVPIDTSAKGFYKMRSIAIPLWIKILVYTCIPASLFLAIICTLDKEEYELSPIAWISLLLLCLLPILYRIKTNKIYNSSKILQKKCVMLLLIQDTPYPMSTWNTLVSRQDSVTRNSILYIRTNCPTQPYMVSANQRITIIFSQQATADTLSENQTVPLTPRPSCAT